MSGVAIVSGMMAPSSSAAGVVSLLEEQDQDLQQRALEKLLRVIDIHWAEVPYSNYC
jgi:hypothetical protein